MLDSDYNPELDASFNSELVNDTSSNELIGHSNNIDEESKKSNITENYLIPIFASIGATTILVGCSCAFGYYMHINGIEIDNLPPPIKYYFLNDGRYYY